MGEAKREAAMKPYKRTVQALVLAVALIPGGSYSSGQAQQRHQAEAKQVPAGAIACRFVARAFLDANGQQGEIFGYFTGITGVGEADTVFNGQPSEKTAFFTFRAFFSLTALPINGDVQPYLVSSGTFNIYYNKNPIGDWSKPESFSLGQQIAHFMRPESLFIRVLQLDGVNSGVIESISRHDVTEILASSQSFTFKGHKYDLGDLVPGGITLYETVSNTGVPGVTDLTLGDLPFGFAQAGHWHRRGQRESVARSST
jgi:hypothetical protein